MGGLNLPESGYVYVDANCVVYGVENVEPFASVLKPLWAAAIQRRLHVVSSEITLLETLVRPLREGNIRLQQLLRDFLLNSQEVRRVPIDLEILTRAAHYRARDGLKTPDAIHAATSAQLSCRLLVTNDADFQRTQGIGEVALLHQLA